MPPVIALVAGYLAISAAAATLLIATVVISAGTAIYGAAQSRKAERQARDSMNAAMKDRMVTRIATEAPHRYVYGRAKVGADIVAMFTSGDKDQFKHLVCVHAAHECDAIEEVWVNNALVSGLDASGDPTTGRFAVAPGGEIIEEQQTGPTFTLAYTPRIGSVWVFSGTGADMIPVSVAGVNGRTVTVATSGPVTVSYEYAVRRKISDLINEASNPSATNPVVRVQKHLGGANDVADAYLRSVVGDKWPATAVLRGMCYTVITLDLNHSEFQGGLVPVHAVIRGRKLYDPRDGQTQWSQNPALAIMDYLTSPLCGVPMSDLPTAQFITAANACDEASPTGGVRYTANGTVTSDQGQAAVLESMTQAMAGGLVATTWDVYAGKYVAPVAALVQEDIVGSLSVIPGVSDASIYNGVKGQYVGPENNHVQTDFKPYQNSVYREADGRDLYTNIDFPFTDSLQRVTNLARIFTEDQRNGFTIKAEFSLKAWPLKVGQRVIFTSKFLGQNAKVYRITDKSYAPNSAVQLSLKEDAPSIWDYADATEVDSTPNSDLPDPWLVSPPGAISCTSGQATLLRQADGSTIPRILVSLSLIQTMIGGQIEIEWRAVSSTAWSRMTISGTQTQAYLSPITPGFFYIVRARCVNPYLNTRSDWVATTYQVVVFSARPKVYKWSESLPAMPSGVSTYNWATSAFTAPAGWTPQITAAPAGGGLMLWAADVLVTDISVDAPTQFYWASASINAITFEESAGLSNFTWTKYATSAAGANMSDSPVGMTHIGLAFNKASATESTDPADYTWAQFQGNAGVSAPLTNTAFLYQWSTATPAKPNSTSSFGWAAGANTGYGGTDGWAIAVPANPGTPLARLFVASIPVTAPAGTTSSTVSYASSTVAAWSQNGSNGANGVQADSAVVYQWAATIPAGPAGSATFTWASRAFGAAPTGWTLTPGGAPSPGLTLFAARVGVTDSATATSTGFTWSTAAVMAIGYAGTNGGNGAEGASYVTAYCASSTMATSTAPGKTSGKSSVPAPNSGGIVGAYTKAVPALANGQLLYQSDGIYDPATNEVTWSIPYWSSLKVATLSAISANFGQMTAGSIDLGSGSTSWHVDANGNQWAGAGTFGLAPFRVTNTGATTLSSVEVLGPGGVVVLSSGKTLAEQIPVNPNLAVSILNWFGHTNASSNRTQRDNRFINGEYLFLSTGQSYHGANTNVLGIPSGCWYTVSFTAYCEGAARDLIVDLYGPNIDSVGRTVTLNNTNTRYTFTEQMSSHPDAPKAWARFFAGGAGSNIVVSNPKVEFGVTATAWCDSVIAPGNSSRYVMPDSITNTQIGGDLFSTNWNGGTDKYGAGWLMSRAGILYCNDVRARGTVSGGDFTPAYAWPANGGTGFHLGPGGLLLGNPSTGRYFQVGADGNASAPGFKLENGQLTLTNTILITPQIPKTAGTFVSSPANSYYFTVGAYNASAFAGAYEMNLSAPDGTESFTFNAACDNAAITVRIGGVNGRRCNLYVAGNGFLGEIDVTITCTVNRGGLSSPFIVVTTVNFQ